MSMTRRELCSILPAALIPAIHASGSSAGQDISLLSAMYPFEKLAVRTEGSAEYRNVLKGKLATGESLEVHETTLLPGAAPHPPHHHAHSEMWLTRMWEKGQLLILLWRLAQARVLESSPPERKAKSKAPRFHKPKAWATPALPALVGCATRPKAHQCHSRLQEILFAKCVITQNGFCPKEQLRLELQRVQGEPADVSISLIALLPLLFAGKSQAEQASNFLSRNTHKPSRRVRLVALVSLSPIDKQRRALGPCNDR